MGQLTISPGRATTRALGLIKVGRSLVSAHDGTLSVQSVAADQISSVAPSVIAPGIVNAQISTLDASKITSGTLALARGGTNTDNSSVTGNKVWASPDSSTGAAAYRALVANDIPGLPASKITSGQLALARGGTAVDNTSVVGNEVFASPDGSTGSATFRTLVAADIPNLSAAKITSGLLASARGGTGVDSSLAANGTLLIGNAAGFTLATLTAGAGISVTNGAGTITVAGSSARNAGDNLFNWGNFS